MPLQPIDLQTLFAHLNQVGRQQANLKAGAVLQQELQGNEIAKQTRLKDETVNETKESSEEQKVKDKQPESGKGPSGEESSRGRGEEREEKGKKEKPNYYEDPALGKNIDITG
jgi:hypothetical protein